jgi:asparagine synthetase B (glutamine-hydrolysing)
MQIYLQALFSEIKSINPELIRVDNSVAFRPTDNNLYIIGTDSHTSIVSLLSKGVYAWLIGDPIIEKDNQEQVEKYLGEINISALLQHINGHYRVIIFDSETMTLYVASSIFGILPVFYCTAGNRIFISGDIELISEQSSYKKLNKRFILENILFYYPLFNQTAYEHISLLPANNCISVSGKGIVLEKHTSISEWFVSQPEPWRKSTDRISNVFIDRVRHYLPEEKYIHALTGGFDSRTLVSCALYYKKNFEAYSFGNEFSSDTSIAAALSSRAGIKYNYIHLDEDYCNNHSLRDGLNFIRKAAGTASFSRAHYLYAARKLAPGSRFLITGNFGSEILRAAHNAGVLISPNLYHLFHSRTFDDAIIKIEQSSELNWLSWENFKLEWESLKNDISGMPLFNKIFSGLSRNQHFYLFIFEETFRKYFGAEMVNQFAYLNNRTPFLDTIFLKEILKTGLAGVYSDFFENNPLKRFKGQLLYAYFIKKTYPGFSDIITDKGYCPRDLLTQSGKFNITKAYLKKKLGKEESKKDPYGLLDSYHHNLSFFKTIKIDDSLFNNEKISKTLEAGKYSDDFSITLSQAYYSTRFIRSDYKA